ncbi:class I SAM-dependent methyltransferase [Nocardia sp. CDC159]|uniref:Class I SAM-dependent methyltransferase n=1 Tax=Nocardia pulmonis TaxID=2951408 RepID=A0A9X2IVX2_9NOCA|nr:MULTISPECIES: class I SAM-dependent methyltransferase [Nocardia]MCM6774337.1 class I SAM-dependent methyltransferase [Nocardia pulmonis]MCM6787597.1 class I SAM-dependent methyltransferase [Nocardia sp. CDC159]
MTMNLVHRWLCSSARWEKASATQIIPWALEGVDLGDATLEVGPGYGANVRALRERTTELTGIEIDPALAARLRARHAGRMRVVEGDGAAMPLPDNKFSAVVSFTMLHHVPSPDQQDAVFAEAFRVLRPGGVFAGSDGLDRFAFRLVHLGDTCVPVPPETLPERLARAGFTDVRVEKGLGSFRFHAYRR